MEAQEKKRHICPNIEGIIFYGSTFPNFPDPDPVEWHLDLGMEWCHIKYCPFCGIELEKE